MGGEQMCNSSTVVNEMRGTGISIIKRGYDFMVY